MRKRLPFWTVLPPLFLTCSDAGPAGPEEPGWLVASVNGSTKEEYRGNGTFFLGRDFRQGISIYFTVNSRPPGDPPGGVYRSIDLYRAGAGRPSVGRYPLGRLDETGGSPRGFTGYFSWSTGREFEAYAARSGEMEITASSPERVEGRFQFTAARYCPRSDSEPGCALPNDIVPGAPTIDVSGSFMAVHGDDTPVVPVD